MVCTGSIQLSSILQTKELAATMLSRSCYTYDGVSPDFTMLSLDITLKISTENSIRSPTAKKLDRQMYLSGHQALWPTDRKSTFRSNRILV